MRDLESSDGGRSHSAKFFVYTFKGRQIPEFRIGLEQSPGVVEMVISV